MAFFEERTFAERKATMLLRQYLFDHMPRDIGEAKVAALEAVRQAFVVESQEVQNRSLQVVDVDGIFHAVIAQLIGLADDLSALDAAAREPQGIRIDVMVAPRQVVAFLALRSPAKLAAPDDQG